MKIGKRVSLILLALVITMGVIPVIADTIIPANSRDSQISSGIVLPGLRGENFVVGTNGTLWLVGGMVFDLPTGEVRPNVLRLMDNVVSISRSQGLHWRGEFHGGNFYAVTADGGLWVWENASHIAEGHEGQYYWELNLIEIPLNFAEAPRRIKDNVASVHAGDAHTLAVTKDGALYAWGFNYFGQIGDGGFEYVSNPVRMMDGIVDAGADIWSSWALNSHGDFYVWGSVSQAFLEPHIAFRLDTPTRVVSGVASAVGVQGATYLQGDDGRVWRFGSYGEPEMIFNDAVQITVTPFQTFALKADGSLWTWGLELVMEFCADLNEYTFVQSHVEPTRIFDDVVAIGAGYRVIALTANGEIRQWDPSVIGNFISEGVVISTLSQEILEGHFSDTHVDRVVGGASFAEQTHFMSSSFYRDDAAFAVDARGILWSIEYPIFNLSAGGLQSRVTNLLENVMAFAVSGYFTRFDGEVHGGNFYVVDGNGVLRFWSSDTYLINVGYGHYQFQVQPHNFDATPVVLMDDVVYVAGGNGGSALAITSNGDLWVWGSPHTESPPTIRLRNVARSGFDPWGGLWAITKDNGLYIQESLDDGAFSSVLGGQGFWNITRVAEGARDFVRAHSTAYLLGIDGRLWGLGYGYEVPTVVLEGIDSFSANSNYRMAVTTNGDLLFWGNIAWLNYEGNPSAGSRPEFVSLMRNVAAVELGGEQAMVVTNDGRLHVLSFPFDVTPHSSTPIQMNTNRQQ